ncbi:hypothetical protein NA56DRAFT_354465 [Hyaloscypha hepaticicola]|uniref:Uncharacterized protein n=1 Tax=Hyaloscypha hepaticicola TaxID=2082293 RepID=A0A2J6PMJ2_9HELO|nr:hypothetical protein NA56DRAFT_354465 [Hyaloscypha hepaticicola]
MWAVYDSTNYKPSFVWPVLGLRFTKSQHYREYVGYLFFCSITLVLGGPSDCLHFAVDKIERRTSKIGSGFSSYNGAWGPIAAEQNRSKARCKNRNFPKTPSDRNPLPSSPLLCAFLGRLSRNAQRELASSGRIASQRMASCPVKYVRTSKSRCTLSKFPAVVKDSSSCADMVFELIVEHQRRLSRF